MIDLKRKSELRLAFFICVSYSMIAMDINKLAVLKPENGGFTDDWEQDHFLWRFL
ncbi:hypothetical protein [uncultured Photobacterium sp.]|uniref:hypothetical protein n=1 Tax=uncultured Photobacterium sp. TaxID=173973 RepID=UPI002602DF90|nr:hypothetical protein [uncultured Photobacterium sp.]